MLLPDALRLSISVLCHQHTQFQVEATVSFPVNVCLRVSADLISVFLSVYPDFLLSDAGELKYLSFCS